MMPRTTRGLRHVALKCHDLARMEAFYAGILGYSVEWRPDPENVYLTNGEDSLALHSDAHAVSAETRLKKSLAATGKKRGPYGPCKPRPAMAAKWADPEWRAKMLAARKHDHE